MTEREIELLRFEKNYTEDYEGDEDYYYSYEIVRGMTLISNCASDKKGNQWEICIFETDPEIVFHDFAELQAFINNLEYRIRK